MDRHDTLMRMDEAVASLVVAKSEVLYIGMNSDYVKNVVFDRFVRDIDEIVSEIIGISAEIEKSLKEDGNVQ